MPSTPLELGSLLRKTLKAVMRGNLVRKELAQDAERAVEWIQKHLNTSIHPTVLVGIGVMVALEMNNISIGAHYVAETLHVGVDGLQEKLLKVRMMLYETGSGLPFSTPVTLNNVMSFAKAIMHLSNVVGKAGAATSDYEGLIAHTMNSKEINDGSSSAPDDRPEKESVLPWQENVDSDQRLLEGYHKTPQQAAGEGRISKNTDLYGQEMHERGVGAQIDMHESEIDVELDDDELDRYLRSDEEVALFEKLHAIGLLGDS